jgi:hypothetical protein
MPLPIGSRFPSRVSAGTGPPGDGSPSVTAAPASSTLLLEVVGLVPIAPITGQQANIFTSPCMSTADRPFDTALVQQVTPSTRLLDTVEPVPDSPGASTPTTSGSAPAPVAAGILRIPPVKNDHCMVTRGKQGFRQPKPNLNLHAATLSPLPKTYRGTLADPNWRDTMIVEFTALQANDNWSLVPRPADTNVVTGKWVFRHKFLTDGALDRYKARWVLHSCTQHHGVEYGETFSPVVKPPTIRMVLSVALSHGWPIHQMDVNNAFLHGTLAETVYCEQPSAFVDSSHLDYIHCLNKSLYDLKQAPHTWYSRFASYITSIGFVGARSDTSLFIYCHGADTTYLLLYVDDIMLTASFDTLLCCIIDSLHHEFSMKDLGDLHHFLGLSVTRNLDGLFLCQRQYTLDILSRAGMADCKPCGTPVGMSAKLSTDGAPVENATDYRCLAGALQFLTFIRSNIA